jgi:hypothetical protein
MTASIRCDGSIRYNGGIRYNGCIRYGRNIRYDGGHFVMTAVIGYEDGIGHEKGQKARDPQLIAHRS